MTSELVVTCDLPPFMHDPNLGCQGERPDRCRGSTAEIMVVIY